MTVPPFGSVAHALTILQAGCILYEDDPRFPPRVFDALERRAVSGDENNLRMGVTYPDKLAGVRWFSAQGAYLEVSGEDEARAELLTIKEAA